MWQTAILTGMLAMAGFYTLERAVSTQSSELTQSTPRSADLANSMAIYRQSILNYLQDHPDLLQKSLGSDPPSLSDEDIKKALPSWYVLPKDANSHPLWAHRICPDKTLIVFAGQNITKSITQDLLKISKNSITVGESIGNTSIYSPVIAHKDSPYDFCHAPAKINTNVESANTESSFLSSCTSITAGRPVWIAKLN